MKYEHDDEHRRGYRMVARAEAMEATREAILDAAASAFWDRPSTDISLDEVAAGAGVSTRTVLRHFETKQALFEAAGERERRRVEQQRSAAPAGDIPGAVTVLVEHYEELGDQVVRMLAEPGLEDIVEVGRQSHRRWCERVFAEALARHSRGERDRRLAQYMAVCDVYTWKVLRRDAGLSRRQTELALVELLQPLVEE